VHSISFGLLNIFIVLTSLGCSTYEVLSPQEMGTITDSQRIIRVIKVNGDRVDCGGGETDSTKICGASVSLYLKDGSTSKIPSDSIKTIYTKEFSLSRTIILGVLGPPAIITILFATGIAKMHQWN